MVSWGSFLKRFLKNYLNVPLLIPCTHSGRMLAHGIFLKKKKKFNDNPHCCEIRPPRTQPFLSPYLSSRSINLHLRWFIHNLLITVFISERDEGPQLMFWERVASPDCKTVQKWIWHSYIMSNQNAEAKGMIEFQTFPLLFLQGKAGGGEHFNKWACWHFLSWKIIFPLE